MKSREGRKKVSLALRNMWWYKYFKRYVQQKVEVLVTGKEKRKQIGNLPTMCFHTVKATDFFSILFSEKNPTPQICDMIFF